MKISIVTVAYNAESTIRDTIESVLSQKNIDLEYIIIDGNSSDNTMSIVEEYKDQISKCVSEKDKGIYDAMNKGVALATGDVIGILNSDDFYSNENVLSDVCGMFNENTDAVYGDLVYVNQANTEKVTRTWISGVYKEGAFRKGWMPPHPTFFVRKEIYEKFGSYTLNLRSAADYEFMLRVIHKEKIRIGYLQKILVKMRVGGESNASISNRLNANKEDKMAWEMNGLKAGKLTFIRKPLSKIGQFIKR